jgi:hypothetical protein
MDTLLIAASFFGYSKEIVKRLEARGRAVLWFEDRPATDTLTKALLRVAPSMIATRTTAHFENVIAQARQHPIRDVLVIKGEALSPEMIQRMREALPQARFTLYFWDSYLNMPADSPDKVPLFDKTFSFDPVDSANDPRLHYRPLFYLNEYADLPSTGHDLDVLFIGTAHTDRYAVLDRLGQALPRDLRFEKVLYFPSQWMYRSRKAFDPAFRKARKDEFVFHSLGKDQVMALIARARIVVDIERPVQTGYTMRTMEMLGGRRKLITTNPKITEASFFQPSNHLYIDREHPVVPQAFMESAWQSVPEKEVARFSLDGWLDEVLAEQPPPPPQAC